MVKCLFYSASATCNTRHNNASSEWSSFSVRILASLPCVPCVFICALCSYALFPRKITVSSDGIVHSNSNYLVFCLFCNIFWISQRVTGFCFVSTNGIISPWAFLFQRPFYFIIYIEQIWGNLIYLWSQFFCCWKNILSIAWFAYF